MCSWFKYNMDFTNVQIPTLLDVQKILVKMEDKPINFLNSKEWIGSVEVYLLNLTLSTLNFLLIKRSLFKTGRSCY